MRRARRRAGGRDVAAARHVRLDDLRHRRPPQVGRRRGRRDRGRPPRRPPGQPARRRDLRRPRSPPRSPPRQGGRGLLSLLLLALRREPDLEPAGPDVARRPRSRAPGGSPAGARWSVVVSDFRGPRDWRAPLLRLAARHDVLAVEIRDPREQELPDVGDLWLVDPEIGTAASRSTPEAASCGSGSRRGRGASATSSRRELRSLGVAHLVLSTRGDWLRDARRLHADRGEAAMSFAWPIALLRARARRARPARATCWSQRRRRQYVGPLHQPRPARERRRATRPRWRRHVPAALTLLAADRARRSGSRGPRWRSPCRARRRR